MDVWKVHLLELTRHAADGVDSKPEICLEVIRCSNGDAGTEQ